jgi:hypothetical protein
VSVPPSYLPAGRFPTLPDLKAMLNIPDTDTSKDTAIQQQFSIVCKNIEDYLGRGIKEMDAGERFEPPDTAPGNRLLFLFRFPIITVNIVQVAGTPITDYRIFAAQGVIELPNRCWPWPRDPYQPALAPLIEVSYRGGYSDNGFPWSLWDALVRTFMARWALNNGSNTVPPVGMPVKAWSADGLAVQLSDTVQGQGSLSDDVIPAELLPVAAQLDPFRRRFVTGV